MRLNVFIRRPILASVISIIIVLCGIVATFNLPVSQFPSISSPTIKISASYPGADAVTAARVVGAQIENQMNGAANLTYMSTNTTATGSVSITLTYEVGTDLNYAINEVLNRLQASMKLLPSVVQKIGVTARKSSPDMLLTIAFYSDPYLDTKYVSNYLERTVENDLLLLPSVGNIGVFGTGSYAMRIWLDPNKMQRYSISVNDIQNAVIDQNAEFIVGRTNSVPNSDSNVLGINIHGGKMLSDPKQFEHIILKNQKAQTVRIKDVARVELGSNSYSTIAQVNFRDKKGDFLHYPCTIMQVFLNPSANQIEAKKQIISRLDADSKSFPYGLKYRVAVDNSRFVEASISGVIETLAIAFLLVGVVIFIFLRNWRASVIAICSIPVSIIGTMACLYVFHFSLNTLSLFALILAIGIVVDDSIIIVENIERLRYNHPDFRLKHVIAMTLDEVFGAVVAIVLVLSVVFIPVMFLSGLSGVMYRQFAVTIACAVVLSGVCALTFTPALSYLLLQNSQLKVHKQSGFFDRGFKKVTNLYVDLAEVFIRHGKIAILVLVLVLITTLLMFKTIPSGFVPTEDQGLIFATVNLPSSSGLEDTTKTVNNMIKKITKNSNIASVVSVVGLDFLDSGAQKTYAASFFIALKDWSDRDGTHSTADDMIDMINKLSTSHRGTVIRAFNQPAIRGLSTTGGVEFYVEDRVVGDIYKLQTRVDGLITRLRKHKEVSSAYQTLDTNTLQISMAPNLTMAKFYGISLRDLYNTLQTTYSNNNINFSYIMQDLVWVIMEADAPFRMSVDGIRNVYLHGYPSPNVTESGNMIPLASVINLKSSRNAQVIQRFNGYMSSKVIVNPAPGYSFGQVMSVVINEMQYLPKNYNYDWFGTSYQMMQSQKTSFLAFSFSLIMIYLVLAALFEMWRLPLVVMMGAPFAMFGAVIILFIGDRANDLYFQISLIALLGLSAKNVILLVEFALQHYNAGNDLIESALHGLRLRFRPLVMTSITFVVGTLPLVFANGAGANAQHSVGLGIIGGILGSMFLATLLTPAYFVLMMRNYPRKKHDDEISLLNER